MYQERTEVHKCISIGVLVTELDQWVAYLVIVVKRQV